MNASYPEFHGRLAVVSGAAQGIGAALARSLADQGCRVAALDLRADGLQQLALHAPAHADGRIIPLPLDIRDGAAVEQAVARIEDEIGAIDMLANVAGVLRLGTVEQLSDEDWLQSFAVNTHGVFFLSRAVARRMQARRRGGIVTVGSNAAEVPRTQMAAYAASKAATTQFSKCLGLELAEFGVRCNIVSPGSTDTAMQRQLWSDDAIPPAILQGSLEQYRTGIPLQRIAAPQDVANAALFLLSDQARHITLHNLYVDGGATLGI